jgi:glycosyltransferase involved in cell wall biosynthesis
MKIYCLLLVRDEADIIAEVLGDAARWADKIIVQDNMSQDGTWEIVQAMAGEVIVPWQRTADSYRSGLRTEAFEAFRAELSDGDWWCRMDADEFYLENPRTFLAQVPRPYHCVFKHSVDYVLTEEDVEAVPLDRTFAEYRPQLHHILPWCHTEPRFFRHRDTLRWHPDEEFPRNRGPRYREAILVKHYQYRSPRQIQHRIDLRNAVVKDRRGKPFKHVTQSHWHETLYRADQVVRDDSIDDFRDLAVSSSRSRQKRTRWLKPVGRAMQLLAYRIGILR